MISGSPRKNGDGAKILEELESVFKENAEVECESLFIHDYKLEACLGCLACQKEVGYNCPLKDDVSKIIEKFDEADGFVFISPVYIRMITAQMKQLFDRMSFLLHRPTQAGKPAMLICNGSYAGAGESLKYLKIPVGNMGTHIVDSIGILSSAYKNNTAYKEKMLQRLTGSGKKYLEYLFSSEKPKPSAWELFLFNKWKHKAIYHRKQYPGDFQFWESRNLLDKDYYYPVKINPVLRHLIPLIVNKIFMRMSRRIGYVP
jgi:multimeric flavodoxin WrbA